MGGCQHYETPQTCRDLVSLLQVLAAPRVTPPALARRMVERRDRTDEALMYEAVWRAEAMAAHGGSLAQTRHTWFACTQISGPSTIASILTAIFSTASSIMLR